jgi:hypothetical protein
MPTLRWFFFDYIKGISTEQACYWYFNERDDYAPSDEHEAKAIHKAKVKAEDRYRKLGTRMTYDTLRKIYPTRTEGEIKQDLFINTATILSRKMWYEE